MPERTLPWLLDAAHARLSQARSLLLHPLDCHVEACTTLFREAQGYMEWLRDSLRTKPPVAHDLRQQMIALGVEIQHAGILLDQAARAGRAWLERIQASAGYTAAGACLPLQAPEQISFFG
jgi:hypothetical protein